MCFFLKNLLLFETLEFNLLLLKPQGLICNFLKLRDLIYYF